MTTTHIIAIDPAEREYGTGWIMLDIQSKVITRRAIKNFIKALEALENLHAYALENNLHILWVVENSNLQDAVFFEKGYELKIKAIERAKKRTFNNHEKHALMLNFAQDTGKNMATSQHICDYLQSIGCNVVQISPKAKGRPFTEAEAKLDARSSKWTLPEKLSGDELAALKLLSLVYRRLDKFQGGEVLK